MTVEPRTRPARRRRSVRSEDRGSLDAPIRTRALTKRYGDLVAVDALDLDVQAGEIFGLLGQNGAGKTTTILMLLGLTEPTGGVARVVGLDPARYPLEVKRRVGYLPDSVGFYAALTGRQNLRYTARLNGLDRAETDGRIGEALEHVKLTDRADSRTDTYSRGMLQRLGIADALIKDPDVLILDEPTTSIDPLGVVEILDLLRDLVRERNLAILLSSHLLSQVQSICDRVGIFTSGRLVGVGTVPDLARRFGEAGARIEVAFEDLDVAAADRVEAALRGVEGVVAVDRGGQIGGVWMIAVEPRERAAEVRRQVLQVAVRDSLGLSSIREHVPSLDDIYRRAVEGIKPRVLAGGDEPTPAGTVPA